MAETRHLCEESPDPGSLKKDLSSDSDEESTPLRAVPLPAPSTTLRGRRKLALRKQRSVPYPVTDETGPRTPSMDKTHSLDTGTDPKTAGEIERAPGLENLSEHPQDETVTPEKPPNGTTTPPGQSTSHYCAKTDKIKTFYINPMSSRKSAPEEHPKKKRSILTPECACLKRRRKTPSEADPDDIYFEQDPFRKRCTRVCLNLVYILLALFAAVFTYSLIADLVKSMNNPVRSIHYHRVEDEYEAPGE